MFFYIINCEPENYIKDNDKQIALTNLLNSHSVRNNIVSSDKVTIEKLKVQPFLLQATRTVASEIYDNFREYNGLLNELTILFEVDFSKKNSITSRNEDRKIITISYDHFIKFDLVQPVRFLAENDRDTDFYKLIGKIYSDWISKIGVDIKFTPVNGAGAGIKESFDRLLSENLMFLCFVDSDKKHPKGPIGQTACRLNAAPYTQNEKTQLVILGEHEAENLIPANVFRDLIGNKTFTTDQVNSHDDLVKIFAKCAIAKKYFDFKIGLKICKARELDNKYGQYWVKLFAEQNLFKHAKCTNEKACGEKSDCEKIHGFGDNILTRAQEYLHNMNNRSIYKMLNDEEINIWIHYGKIITSWACSPMGRIARS